MIQPRTLRPGLIYLVTGPSRFTTSEMHRLLVEAALLGPVKILLGGNRFLFYEIAYALAAQTERYEEILEKRITLSRAETCYQVLALLAETESTPTLTLVSDLLTSFYDQGVPEKEVDQLLFESLLELRRLSRAAPVVVSAHGKGTRPRLLKALERSADEIFSPQSGAEPLAAQQNFAT